MPSILIASLIVALVSISGVLLFRKEERLKGTHRSILPLAVGVFLGIVFLELIPETLHLSEYGPFAILAGFFGFYLISHFLSTYHHHHDNDHDACNQNGARMLLIGDSIHNVADGVVLASAFIIHPVLGIVTTFGIILHELPQEIAEFSVLMHAGYSRTKALLLNLLSASSILIGALLTLLFAHFAESYIWILTGLAAGNLLYIATSDFIPELRESHKTHFAQVFLTALVGVLLIAVMLGISHEFIAQFETLTGEELRDH